MNLEARCPNCLAPITHIKDARTATCDYCGSTFLINQDEQEKPQEPPAQKQGSTIGSRVISMEPKTLILWILGWVFCPILPLSILLWRSNINPLVKNTICGMIWAVLIMSLIAAVLN